MPDFDMNQAYEEASKEYNIGQGNDRFKIQEGDNKMRLVSICIPHESFFKGKRQFKWLCQVLDRRDGKVKPYFMPNTIYDDIRALQMDPEYAFKGVPMPYDLNINAEGAGNIDVKYKVIPARNNTELTTEEMNLVIEAPDVKEIQEKIREKELDGVAPDIRQSANEMEAQAGGTEDISVEDIPF